MIIVLAGCADSGSNDENEVLIRIGDRIVTVLEFNEAFEIAKTAFPHHIRHNREDLQQAQLRLLNQMTVEMILLERAEELGIEISEAEVEKAVAEIKNDYPEGVFEETLLEFAVSYKTWKDRLRIRLIIEKVVDKELKDQIKITPEDIARYYEENYKGQKFDSNVDENAKDINEDIIKNLRRKKTEQGYNSWINELKTRYEIEVNSAQWEKIIGSNSIAGKDSGK
ncbi:MAG: SurA N-terminal domain-containing protein [Desulfobacterales bacterium]|nr:MAG: SurA N-terminal domain-containing protein [Desulfobacterales bacterium]